MSTSKGRTLQCGSTRELKAHSVLQAFQSLGYSGDIRKARLTFNVNKLHHQWRSFAAAVNKCLSGKTPFYMTVSSFSKLKSAVAGYVQQEGTLIMHSSEGRTSFSRLENQKYEGKGSVVSVNPRLLCISSESSPSYSRQLCHGKFIIKDPSIAPRRKQGHIESMLRSLTQCYNPQQSHPCSSKRIEISTRLLGFGMGGYLCCQCALTNKSGKGKQKTTELENISEADLTEAEQLKIVTKRSRQETHSSHASGSGADEGTGVTPGVPDAPDYDSEDDISWKSSDDDQDDEQAQDDDDADKNDVNETTQDDEDDDVHDDDENAQEDDDEHDDDKKADDDDDEELTESDDDGDDFVHPKLTTHDDEIIHEEDTDEDDSSISSSDEEDSDNDVEGARVAGAKSGKDTTDTKDQGNEAVKDTNTDLDGRDKVMTDVEDTHVTLTPVNPDGQQQSSSVSSGFVSNMLNPNQDTGVDDIFRQHTEATSLIDTSVTAIMEPSFTAQINRLPYLLDIQTQQPPIMTPATTTSSLLQNLPNFASLFGFDHRLKALEDKTLILHIPIQEDSSTRIKTRRTD
ncbi:hypothetical protein Tco_1330954 [Tanacetum coccineum]